MTPQFSINNCIWSLFICNEKGCIIKTVKSTSSQSISGKSSIRQQLPLGAHRRIWMPCRRSLTRNICAEPPGVLAVVPVARKEEPPALPHRSLIGKAMDAVPPHIKNSTFNQLPTPRSDDGKKVIRQRKIQQIRQIAHQLRHLSVQKVSGEVELLNLLQAAQRARQRAGQEVVSGVKNGGLF